MSSLAWLAATSPNWVRFRRALKAPEEAQRARLRGILRRNAGTEFGRAAGFATIHDADEFRRRVPLQDWEDVAPWVSRIAAGEASVLTRSPVTTLQPTGGSSGGAKAIPFTRELARDFRRAVAPWVFELFRTHPGMIGGSAYWSISPLDTSSREGAGPVPESFADDSEYLGGWMSRLVERTFAVPPILRFAADLETFRYLTLLFLLRRRDLSLISIWHPTFLALLLDALPGYWEALLSDIERGRATPPSLFSRPLPAMPALASRAAELRAVGSEEPRRIWPRLAVVSCWADGHAVLAAAELARRLDGIEIQAKGLLATEAVVTLPFQGLRPIAVRSHFFEFLPEGETERTCRVGELESGEVYSVVVTTGGGLYRYRLEDRVEVEGRVGSTSALRFLGRGGKVSDLRGEKLHDAFVAGALARVWRRLGWAARFALLAPGDGASGPARGDTTPCYTLYLDGGRGSEPVDCAAVAAALEQELEASPHYRTARVLGQLEPVRAALVLDAESRYLARCRELGQRLGDVKPAALSMRGDWDGVFGRASPLPPKPGPSARAHC